jgi:hypothetical protein
MIGIAHPCNLKVGQGTYLPSEMLTGVNAKFWKSPFGGRTAFTGREVSNGQNENRPFSGLCLLRPAADMAIAATMAADMAHSDRRECSALRTVCRRDLSVYVVTKNLLDTTEEAEHFDQNKRDRRLCLGDLSE